MNITVAERKQRATKWHKLEAQARAQVVLWQRKARFRHRKHVYWHDLTVKTPSAIEDGPVQMYDSIYPSKIPADAPAVAGYVGGKWPTFSTLAKLFPKARRVSIAVASYYDADVLDVEPGDATPAVVAGWVKRQLVRGVKRPGVYCSVSAVREVLAALNAAGIKRSQIKLWTAHYTFKPHICSPACGFNMPTTADATQFTDKALGRTLDESRCAPSFWD